MAMNPENDETQTHTDTDTDTEVRHGLPCGRSVEQVWTEMESGAISAHTAGCPHCSTARDSLDQLAEATRHLVADPIEPPPGLLDRILGAVRADFVPPDPIPLPPAEGGVDISTRALAAVLRYAVDTVAGLRAHRCRIEPVVGAPDFVHVRMSVSLNYHTGRADALDQARGRIRAALSERIGLGLGELDLEVSDVWLDDARPAQL